MIRLLAILLAAGSLSAAAGQAGEQKTLSGVITDQMCAGVGHQVMRMGPTDAECTRMCVLAHESAFVLEVSKDEVYTFTSAEKVEPLAGQRVRVTGRVDAKAATITIESIVAAS
jgi:hypothetical protein